jgi:hypothetical protein
MKPGQSVGAIDELGFCFGSVEHSIPDDFRLSVGEAKRSLGSLPPFPFSKSDSHDPLV